MSKPLITVEAIINKPIDQVWEMWTKPEHITQWCFAADEWHAPSSTSDFKIGNTQMLTNQLGYVQRNENVKFNPEKYFNI